MVYQEEFDESGDEVYRVCSWGVRVVLLSRNVSPLPKPILWALCETLLHGSDCSQSGWQTQEGLCEYSSRPLWASFLSL